MAPVTGMDFARNQLLKYGWKEGKGLGKNESGIAKAVRPKLKFDTHGVGHDASEQFTYNWWEHAYNKAAGNIHVSTTENGVAVELQDESIDITTKKYSLKKLQKKNPLEYGTFLKTSTLTQDGQMVRLRPETTEVLELDNSVAVSENLTDEELFRICGGRTVHKGARHGLKLNGKLARIEEQEKQLLAQIKVNQSKDGKSKSKHTEETADFGEFQTGETKTVKKKKKKSKRRVGEVSTDEHFEQSENEINLPLQVYEKTCKKVQEQLDFEATLESATHVPNEIQKKKKAKTKKVTKEDECFSDKQVKNSESEECKQTSLDTEVSGGISRKNKKKKRKNLLEHSVFSVNDITDTEEIKSKRKKQKYF